jgi:glycosyltransferase involved in cell wall biosynthesis
MLAALARLVEQGLNVRIKLIGDFVDADYRRAVWSRIQDAGLAAHVEVTGFQDDVRKQLAGLDVFAMPSLFGEGMPMALLEAMAVGCVIVASRVDGITEPLDDGRCGAIVEPGDDGALALAIHNALTTGVGATRLAAAAQARQRALYAVDVMARSIFSVYAQHLQAR